MHPLLLAPPSMPHDEPWRISTEAYSPECVEGEFSELPLYGVLGSSGASSLAVLVLLLELVPSGSLQGPLEPCQPLIPYTLSLARAQRREHLQRPCRVRLTVEPHPRPSIDSLEGEPRSGRVRSHPRLERDLPIGLNSRVAHRSISNISQMRCLLAHSECSTRIDRSLGGLLYGLDARVHRWNVG